ncbi:tetratricopeptide (TPR) repeat protein [Bacilli bacterium PM5-3]|nr:tetratricopeptide (TPR) repeat protein [Bacilli bacterium PM5-3]MDH6602886.1 tetratricopeptide (TPR) repeat protein [Bacilli bacterium PM5-9]
MEEIKKLIVDEKYEDALKKLLVLEGQYLSKIQCLYELKKYNELVIFFEQIVDSIEDDYFEILGYYILSLIEQEEFDKALSILNEELSMPYIQDNYEEVLNNLYDDVVAKKQAYLIESGVYNQTITEEDIVEVLFENNYDEQLSILMKLDDYNVRKIKDDLEKYLLSEKSPVLKTFILEVFIKQQISDVILVNKHGYEYEFMASANQLVFQDINYLKTRNLLEEHLAKFPSYLVMALDILDLFVYIIYPQTIDVDEINSYAALIEYYIFSLNIDELVADFEEFYNVDTSDIINRVDFLIEMLESEEKYVNAL